jgi:hypothetical protein
MPVRVVTCKAGQRCDSANSIRRGGITPKKVMLRQFANKSVTTKKKGERFNDCALAAVVRADQDGVIGKADVGVLYAAKSANLEVRNLHVSPATKCGTCCLNNGDKLVWAAGVEPTLLVEMEFRVL